MNDGIRDREMAMKKDAQLQTDVLDELQWDPDVDATQIGVTVKDGIVTLAGKVSVYAEKFEAEQAAKRVYGVRAVANDIEVQVPWAAPAERRRNRGGGTQCVEVERRGSRGQDSGHRS